MVPNSALEPVGAKTMTMDACLFHDRKVNKDNDQEMAPNYKNRVGKRTKLTLRYLC